MVGRLQTERDKARLLDGMSAAAGTVDVQAVSSTISGLGKREFVLKRAGKDQPEVFTTRWAMSYLRGPAHPRPDQPAHGRPAGGRRRRRPRPRRRRRRRAAPAGGPGRCARHALRPPQPPHPPARPRRRRDAAHARGRRRRAGALARPRRALGVAGRRRRRGHPPASRPPSPGCNLRFDEEKADLVVDEEWEAVLYPLVAQPDPATAVAVDYDDRDLLAEAPPAGGAYAIPDAPIKQKTYWTGLQRDLVDWLVRNRTTTIFTNRTLKLYSRVGEDQAAFVARCQEAGQAKADEEAAKLRDKYRTKLQAIETKQAAAQEKASVAAAQLQEQQSEQLGSAIGTVLGAFLGGRRRTRSLTGGRSTAAQSARLDSAQQRLADLGQDAAELEQELQQELAAIDAAWDAEGGRRHRGRRAAREGRRERRPGLPRLDPDLMARHGRRFARPSLAAPRRWRFPRRLASPLGSAEPRCASALALPSAPSSAAAPRR